MRRGDLQWLIDNTKAKGIELHRYGPGDGVTRYQFYRNGHMLFSACGFQNARDLWKAYLVGLWDATGGEK